jgi:uncharacterized protein HemY
MKTKILIIIFLIINQISLYACPMCEKQQPKILRGITHGTGPQSMWDWVIVALIALIVLFTLIYSIKFLVFPGEKNQSHIKHSVLNDEYLVLNE